eukprot:CAMPEP_0175435480 /NCGR_PEP_ID=MMETSP0095-20121207/54445_1 /TAXON_ID=311494 /ORGANISM="Alexandrium monilatum, Strain CCMP3105" /LENGTH=82 /DNA_ID=CAMNT_0016735061 /DNA_START=67 /DNA_END=312 /DNA_ORIENTATION=-
MLERGGSDTCITFAIMLALLVPLQAAELCQCSLPLVVLLLTLVLDPGVVRYCPTAMAGGLALGCCHHSCQWPADPLPPRAAK